MPEPTIGELTSIRPEATTNPGVILDSRDAVHQLNQSAQFNAEMKQRKYTQGLENLKSIYQDLGAIQETPVMQQDRPVLNRKMADVLNVIAEDPHAALGGPKFNEIQRQLGELRTIATTSKQDNIYNTFHEKTLETDPELATPENKSKVAKFGDQPVGQRQKVLLETPVKFDPEAAMGKILQQKQVAVPYAETGFEGANNEWMTRTTGTSYKRDSALNIWNQGYETGTDANNQPIKKWATEQFYRIKNDPAQLQKFGNPKDPEELYQNIGQMMYGSKTDIVGEKTSTRTANPYSMLGQRENAALYMEAMREGNREKLAAVKKNLELKGAPENANFLVRQYANVLANTTGEQKLVDIGGGRNGLEDVIDVPANILKNYAQSRKETLKEGQSFDPITETIVEGNTPDLTTRTEDGNIRISFFKRYDKEDKKNHTIPKGKQIGDIATDSQGREIYDKSGIIPRRNLLSTMGKGVVQTKLLAPSIDQADKALKGLHNTDIDKINSGDDDGTVITQAHESKGKTFTFKGKKYSESQLEKAAKASGMTIDEYKKQLGIK